jgi:hypothetical protein
MQTLTVTPTPTQTLMQQQGRCTQDNPHHCTLTSL